MCTDRTLWDILCKMTALIGHCGTSCVKCALIGHCGTSCVKYLHHIKYCSVIVGFLLVTLGKLWQGSTEKGESCNVSDIQTAQRTELLLRVWWWGNVRVCLFVCLLNCINSDKFVLRNENHAIYHTSRQRKNWYWEDSDEGMCVCVFVRQKLILL